MEFCLAKNHDAICVYIVVLKDETVNNQFCIFFKGYQDVLNRTEIGNLISIIALTWIGDQFKYLSA